MYTYVYVLFSQVIPFAFHFRGVIKRFIFVELTNSVRINTSYEDYKWMEIIAILRRLNLTIIVVPLRLPLIIFT